MSGIRFERRSACEGGTWDSIIAFMRRQIIKALEFVS